MSESHDRANAHTTLDYRVRVRLLYAIGHAGDYRKLVARGTAKYLVALTSWPLTSIQKLARTRRRLTANAVVVLLVD